MNASSKNLPNSAGKDCLCSLLFIHFAHFQPFLYQHIFSQQIFSCSELCLVSKKASFFSRLINPLGREESMSASHQALLKQFLCWIKTTLERTSAITETRRHKATPQISQCTGEFSSTGLIVRQDLACVRLQLFWFDSSKAPAQSAFLKRSSAKPGNNMEMQLQEGPLMKSLSCTSVLNCSYCRIFQLRCLC